MSMLMPENIFAYTEPGANMPDYISVNRVVSKTVDMVFVTVRGKGKTVDIELPADELRKLAAALSNYTAR